MYTKVDIKVLNLSSENIDLRFFQTLILKWIFKIILSFVLIKFSI